jgi:hypothetical protein
MKNKIKINAVHTGKAINSLVLFALFVMMMADTALAESLYKTSFENPPFAPNSLLKDQDGWIALPSPPFSPDAATITNDKAKSGKQSVVVPGGLLDSQVGVSPYDAVAVYRRPLTINGIAGYDTANGKKWARVDADLMLETPKRKTPGEFYSLTLSARADNNIVETPTNTTVSLGEIGLSSAGVVEAFAYDTLPGGAPLANCSRRIHFNRWHHITLLHNFTNHVTSYFIDDHFLCSAPPTPPEFTVLLRGAMGVFARPDGDPLTGPNSVRSDYNARFDKYRISIHNEAPEID